MRIAIFTTAILVVVVALLSAVPFGAVMILKPASAALKWQPMPPMDPEFREFVDRVRKTDRLDYRPPAIR